MIPEEGAGQGKGQSCGSHLISHPLSRALLLTDQLGSEAAAGPAAGRVAGSATQHEHPLQGQALWWEPPWQPGWAVPCAGMMPTWAVGPGPGENSRHLGSGERGGWCRAEQRVPGAIRGQQGELGVWKTGKCSNLGWVTSPPAVCRAGNCTPGLVSPAVWEVLGQSLLASKPHATYPPEEAEHR